MKIKISEIKVQNRMRRVKPENVEELARSIDEVGLIQPITLDENNVLVAGLHRYEACKLLGWEEIEYTTIKCDSIEQQKLAEIDENFVRADFTALQQAEIVVERDRLYYEIQRKSRRIKQLDEKKHQPATIFGDNLIGTRIPAEIKERIYGTELENQKTNLVTFSFLPEEKKIEVLDKKEQHPEMTYREIIDEVRSDKREYKDILISTKVERWVFDIIKHNADKAGQSVYEQAGVILLNYAKYLRNNATDIVPAELEEMFDGFSTLSTEDYQTTKKGAAI